MVSRENNSLLIPGNSFDHQAECFGHKTTVPGDTSPRFHKETSFVDEGTSVVDHKTSVLGEESSRFGNETSVIDEEISVVDEGTSVFDHKTSVVGEESSRFGNESSSFGYAGKRVWVYSVNCVKWGNY